MNGADSHAKQQPKPPSPWLLRLPRDLWPLVRELCGAEQAVVLARVCQQLRRLVTRSAGFWQGFRPPEFDLGRRRHQRLLAAFRSTARLAQAGVSVSLRNQAALNAASALLAGLAVHRLSFSALDWQHDVTPVLQAPRSVVCLRFSRCRGHGAVLRALRDRLALRELECNDSRCAADTFTFVHLQKFRQPRSFCLTDSLEISLYDSLLQELSKLTQLEQLRLVCAPIITNAELPDLTKLQALKELQLNNMSETDQALAAISRLPKLEKLAINNSRGITDAGLAPLSELKSLRHLDLLDCWPIHGTRLVQLAGLRLTYLAVTLTSCSDQVLADLPHTTALRKLGFTDCPAVTNEQLATFLSRCALLEELAFADCFENITDLSALSSISVQSLSFVGCGINDATVAGLSECKSLRKLELYACENITDACLETLHGLRPLRVLEITRCNQITANSLQTLRQQRPELTIRYEVASFSIATII